MSRKTRVVGFSLPPETHNKVEKLIKSEHKTRSEFFRGFIDLYTKQLAKDKSGSQGFETYAPTERDLATILKSYWQLRSQSKLEIIPIGLAMIINKRGQILIGARRAKDKWVENLTWVFPGGKLNSLDFENELKSRVREEVGGDVKVKTLVSARIHPDAGFKDVQIVALYFFCEPLFTHSSPKADRDLSELKWVRPGEVYKYFTTSTNDDVTRFLMSIEKGS